MRRALALALLGALAACKPGHRGDVPGDARDHLPFSAIAPDTVIHFTGTEPFWGGQAGGGSLTYTTPEDSAGRTIAVTRFAGRGGLSFSGELDGAQLDLTVTPADCSDGMSDRRYPYAVMLMIGQEVRQGCGWSAGRPFAGSGKP